MGFRFSMSAVLAFALFSNLLSSQTAVPASVSDPGWVASIQVQIHDGSGHPVLGLSADDFILTEHGERDAIIAVRGMSGTPTPLWLRLKRRNMQKIRERIRAQRRNNSKSPPRRR